MDKIKLCSGYGVTENTNLSTIGWVDVQRLVDNPTDVEKTKAQWIIPSSLQSRRKEKQERKGEYWLCAFDFDNNPPEVPELAKIIRKIFEDEYFSSFNFELYNTNSATPDNPKSRLLIPLEKPLKFEEWYLLQKVIADKFEKHNVIADKSLERPAQLSFLPNGKAGENINDKDGKVIGTRIYEKESERDGEALNPDLFGDNMKALADELQHQEDELNKEKAKAKAARSMVKKPTSNDSRNLIKEFNKCYDVASLLTANGYAQRGNKFRHPNSGSGSYSASLKDGRVHSLSTNDRLYTNSSGAHDAFSVFTVLQHGGDRNSALKDAGDNFLTIDGEAWNKVIQREFMQSREQEKVMNGFDDAELADKDKWKKILENEIKKLNKQYALVLNGSKTVVMKTTYDGEGRKERVYLSTRSFDDLYSNRLYKTGVTSRGCNIFKGLGKAWREHTERLDYIDGIIFEPSKYENGIEIKSQITGHKLNLWEGFSVNPKQEGILLCQGLYDHILDVICDGDHECYDYLLNWIARGFQSPAENGQVAVVLKGEKGSGKGTLGKLIKTIYGQHGVQITNPKYLIGNFNAHLQDCCFLFADEAFFAGDKQHENILKSLITEDTMQIERKGIDVITVKNRLKLLMASNNDWVAPATKDERRYFVLDVSSKKIGNTKYFEKLHSDIRDDDVKAAFLFDMLNRDISKFHVNKVPETAGLKSQRLQTLDSFGRYWVDVLNRGYLFEAISHNEYDFNQWMEEPAVQLINAGYEQWRDKHKLTKFDILSETEVGKRLTKWYGSKKRGSFKKIAGSDYQGNAIQTTNRPSYYSIGNLEDAKKVFCEFERIDLTIV